MNEEKEEGSKLVNPDELQQRRRRKPQQEEISENVENIGEKYQNLGNKVKIVYESSGRFDIPLELYFKDYDVEDITSITMCRPDDLLETIVAILNKCCSDKNTNVGNMTQEEFFETLIGMKIEYNKGKDFKYKWECECQEHLPTKEKKLSSMPLDLTTVKYKSIEECEKELRKRMKITLESLSKEQYQEYLHQKYGEDSTFLSIEEELINVKIKEPLILTDMEGNVYKFRLNRIKDVIDGYKIACQKWNGKIRLSERMQPKVGMSKEDFIDEKESAIEKFNRVKAEDTISITRALSLISKNGKVLEQKEKISEFKSMDRKVFFHLLNFTNNLEFGVCDERKLICNMCGKEERGELQRKLAPTQLLPIDDTDSDATSKQFQGNTGCLVFFGQ